LTSSIKRDHAAIARAFEDAVLSGAVPVGALFRKAIERQRRDLARQGGEGFPYVFEPDMGAKVCRFIETFLVHVEGAEDLVGRPLILADFQVWMLVVGFGWIQPGTRRPRFRRIIAFMPSGSGKSTLSAGVAAYFLCVDKGASTIVTAATSRDQARLVFDWSRRMLLNAPKLLERFGVVVEEHLIKRPATGSVYKPLSREARAAEGKLPRLTIVDEVHVHPDRDLWDNLRKTAAKRPDSVLLAISTAGNDTTGIGYEVYGYARDILTGEKQDDSQFALLLEADPKRADGTEVDPFAPETIKQANPALGISIDPIEVMNEANEARISYNKRASYFVKRLGWWQHAANPWMNLEAWDACADPGLDRADFAGERGFVGLDLANRSDLTCKALVFPRERDDGQTEYVVFCDSYLNEDALRDGRNVDYPKWRAEGWIIETPGNVTDLDRAEADVLEDARTYSVVKVGSDPHEAQMLLAHLEENGIDRAEVRTTYKDMNTPMKDLEALVLQGRIRHDGNPVLRWGVGNVEAAMQGDHVRPVKPKNKPEKKIDPAVALLNAIAVAAAPEVESHVGDLLL
jgi:phage terminase large subunit-like protein